MRKDKLGYYAALNVNTDAAPEEIELSYRLLKRSYQERRAGLNIGKVQAAYETLRDPQQRRTYDGMGNRKKTGGGPSQPVILGLLVCLLAVLVVVFHGSEIRARLTHFDPGDELYLRDNGLFFGTVQQFDNQHVFFNGTRAPAYLIEVASVSDAEWYPARDLTRLCQER